MKKQAYILAAIAALIPAFFSASESLSASINHLSSSFYQETFAASDKNEIFSPYCLFNALSMVYTGSDGVTSEEIRQMLKLDLSQEDLPSILKAFSNTLLSSGGLQFSSANSLWVNQNAYILPSYLRSIQTDLGASVTPLDFSDRNQSAETINHWTRGQTKGLLEHVVGARDISRSAQLMLISALYFKGSFKKPFPAKLTRQDLFYKTEFETKSVSMMSQKGTFPYYENDDVRLLLLPFSGDQIACFIALPKKSLQTLDASNLSDWIDLVTDVKVEATIPRFEIHPRYDLIPILSQLGMPSAFSSEANFSKINGRFDLCIDKAIHEAFFSLNEVGVTAAAVTAIGVGHTCVRMEEEPAISFTANHPFLFGIVDLKSNVMLFLGKMMEP